MHEQGPKTGRIEIVGEAGFTLRQLTVDDAKSYLDLIEYNRSHLSRHGDVTSLNYPDLDSVVKSIVQPDNPLRLRFGIWPEEIMVGTVNLTPRGERRFEIGYWVGAEHIGHGYAAEAAKMMVEYGFDKAGADLLLAVVNIGNKASVKTIEKVGFQAVALDQDSTRFELSRDDFYNR